MNFLACGPGRPVVSRMNGTRLGYLSNLGTCRILVFSALLAISLGFVLAAETRDGLQEKGATIETSKYVIEPLRLKTRSIRACSVCPLTTTGEGRYFLFYKYFDSTVRLDDIRKATRQCCMSAINTSSISAAIAMMLFRIWRSVANDTCRTFVGAKLYHICRVSNSRMRKDQSSGNRDTEATILNLICFTARLQKQIVKGGWLVRWVCR